MSPSLFVHVLEGIKYLLIYYFYRGSVVFRKLEIKQVQAVISLSLLEEFECLKFIFDIRNCFSLASLLRTLNEINNYVVIHKNTRLSNNVSPIPVVALSKAWVCGR